MNLKQIFLWLLKFLGLERIISAFRPKAKQRNTSQSTQTKPHSLVQMVRQSRGGSINILVVGRSGSGKSHFINSVCSDPEQCGTCHLDQGTLGVKSHRTPIPPSGKKFKLIDTPGFHNINLSDTEVFCRIAEYLFHLKTSGRHITGIIYLHPAGDDHQSEVLQRNVRALTDLFLGETGLPRLTILVTQTEPGGVDPEMIARTMHTQNSAHPVFGRARAGKSRIAVARSVLDFGEAVRAYESESPITLPIHQYDQHSLSTLASQLDGLLGCYSLGKQPTSLQAQLEEIQSNLKSASDDTAHYQAECARLQRLCIDQQASKEAVDRQLKQIEEEYASLRSLYQLHNHIEQKDIVQGLTDLNFKIRRLGQAISKRLIDHHVESALGKDPDDVTTLDASDLPELKSWFQKRDDIHHNHSSLVLSSDGTGRDVDSFFDLAICTSLCTLLVNEIFQPFYPCVDRAQYAPDSSRMAAIYQEVQQQEPQYMAGKWRSITFKSIHKPTDSSTVDGCITALTEKFLHESLRPLITHFLGLRQEDVKLPQQHFDHCRQLVRMAWEWNLKLKEEVIMLGDFEQTTYAHCSIFDPTLMEECEPNPRRPQPECILGTLGLGLVSSQAVGEGRPPEKVVVCKAVVITDSFYG